MRSSNAGIGACRNDACMNATCMMCGQDGDIRWVESDTYCEYGKTPEAHDVVWVYCRPCDCWTHHGLANQVD